jgi:hypothetical protein
VAATIVIAIITWVCKRKPSTGYTPGPTAADVPVKQISPGGPSKSALTSTKPDDGVRLPPKRRSTYQPL